MSDPVAGRLRLLERALDRLDEALARPADGIVRDAAIQRFEFTFEMAWKPVRAYASSEGLDCVSPRDSFRVAFRLGLVDKDASWMAMVEDRNRTTHTYDEAIAQRIFEALPGYARLLRRLLDALTARLTA